MLITGIRKTTLIDYPGKVATIIFTAGCNLRCKFCHNSEFVLPERIKEIKDFIPEDIFINFLKTRIGLIDWIVICGGEPTIQKDLKEFCKRVKNIGMLIKLDTNGGNPEVLKDLIENKLVDYVAMDIKGDFKNENEINGLLGVEFYKDIYKYKKSIETLINSDIDYEFRTTLIKGFHNKDNFLNMLDIIKGSKKYFLQNYKSGNILDKDFKGTSFSTRELEEFRQLAIKEGISCEIR